MIHVAISSSDEYLFELMLLSATVLIRVIALPSLGPRISRHADSLFKY
jgi:hypothetical protein